MQDVIGERMRYELVPPGDYQRGWLCQMTTIERTLPFVAWGSGNSAQYAMDDAQEQMAALVIKAGISQHSREEILQLWRGN